MIGIKDAVRMRTKDEEYVLLHSNCGRLDLSWKKQEVCDWRWLSTIPSHKAEQGEEVVVREVNRHCSSCNRTIGYNHEFAYFSKSFSHSIFSYRYGNELIFINSFNHYNNSNLHQYNQFLVVYSHIHTHYNFHFSIIYSSRFDASKSFPLRLIYGNPT